MTYSQWLETLIGPIQAFLGWASTITTALLGNYIFITVVGLFVMLFLLDLFVSHFTNLGHKSNKNNLDNGGKKQ